MRFRHSFIRHPTLSEKLIAPKVLQALNFKLDENEDIRVLLDAAMPGNKYEFLSVVGMTISMGNSDLVTHKTKQHSNVSFLNFIITSLFPRNLHFFSHA